MAKCELQAGRLNEEPSAHYNPHAAPRTTGTGSTVSSIKVVQARQKKERLSYAIDRLHLQAQQKERQLRKSLAAPPVLDDDF